MTLSRVRGFTLIELLVVVSIISTLSSVVLASLSQARKAAINSRQLQHVQQYERLVIAYHSLNGRYPQMVTGDTTGVSTQLGLTSVLMSQKLMETSLPAGTMENYASVCSCSTSYGNTCATDGSVTPCSPAGEDTNNINLGYPCGWNAKASIAFRGIDNYLYPNYIHWPQTDPYMNYKCFY